MANTSTAADRTSMFGLNPFGFDRAALSHNLGRLSARGVNERALIGVLAGHGIIRSYRETSLYHLSDIRAEHLSRFVNGTILGRALSEYSELMLHEHLTLDQINLEAIAPGATAAQMQRLILTAGTNSGEVAAAARELRGQLMDEVAGGDFCVLGAATTTVNGIFRALSWVNELAYRNSKLYANLTIDMSTLVRPKKYRRGRWQAANLVADTIRMEKEMRALFQLTEVVTQRPEFGQIREDWWMDGMTRMPPRATQALSLMREAKLADDGGMVLDALVRDVGSEFSRIARADGEGIDFDRRHISAAERTLMRDVALLHSMLQRSRQAEAEGRLEDVVITQREALERAGQLIERFRTMTMPWWRNRAMVGRRLTFSIGKMEIGFKGRGQENLNAVLDGLHGILRGARTVSENAERQRELDEQIREAEAQPRADRARLEDLKAQRAAIDAENARQAETLEEGLRSTLLSVSDFVSESKDPKLLLRAWNIVAMSTAILYMFYRVAQFSCMVCGGVAWGAALLLLSAELFYGCLITLNLFGNIKLLMITGGANGSSHNPRITAGLPLDSRLREAWGEILVCVNEPGSAIDANARSHLLAIMLSGPNSSIIHGLLTSVSPTPKSTGASYAGTHTVLEVTAARKVVYEQMLLAEGLDWIIADPLSAYMATEYTEIDDGECRRFAAMRLADIAAHYSVDELRIKKLGQRLGEEILRANAGVKMFGRPLTTTMNRAQISQELIMLGVPAEKVYPIAAEIEAELQSLLRRSHIAKSFHWIMRGRPLDAAERRGLRDAMVLEFGASRAHVADTLSSIEKVIGQIVQNNAVIENTIRTLTTYKLFDFTRTPDGRTAFHRVCRVLDVIARGDKRHGQVAEGLHEKLTQIIEFKLFVDNSIFEIGGEGAWRRIRTASPVAGPMQRHALAEKVALDLAAHVAQLDDFWEMVEEQIGRMVTDNPASGAYEAAFEAALEKKQKDIREQVAKVCRRQRIFDVDMQADIAEAVVENFEAGLRFKLHSAEASMHQLLGDMVANEGKPEGEDDALLHGQLGEITGDGGARDILVGLMLREESLGLRSALGTPVEARIKRICATVGNPHENRGRFISRLRRECRMTDEIATRLADGYEKIYDATFGEMRRAISDIRGLRAQGFINPIVPSSHVQGDKLFLDGVTVGIDLSDKAEGAKGRVHRYVKDGGTEIVYPGGQKGGVVNALIRGWNANQCIGIVWQQALATIIRERFSVCNQDDESGEDHFTGLNKVSPDIITFINRELTGSIPALLPDDLPPELRRPADIAAFLIGALGGRAAPRMSMRDAANEMLRRMRLQSVENREEILGKLIYVAEEIASRIDFAEIVQRLGAAQAQGELRAGDHQDVRRIVAEVISRRGFGEREDFFMREMERLGFGLKQAFLEGVCESAGPNGRRVVRLTAAAARDCRDEEILFNEWSEVLDSYQRTARNQALLTPLPQGVTIAPQMISQHTRKQLQALLQIDIPHEALANIAARRGRALGRPAGANLSDLEVLPGIEELFTVVANHTLAGRNLADTCAAVFDWFGVAEDTAYTEGLRNALTAAVKVIRQDIWMASDCVVPSIIAEVRNGARGPKVAKLVEDSLTALDPRLNMDDAEKAGLFAATAEMVEVFSDLGIKIDDGAMALREAPHDGSLVVLEQDPAGRCITVRQQEEGKKFVEELWRRMIFVEPMTADQILERTIATSGLPNVTKGREALASEVRKGGVLIEAALEATIAETKPDGRPKTIREKIQEEVKARTLQGKDPLQISREVLQLAVELVSVEIGKQTTTPNYMADAKMLATPLIYAILHLDDADYRTYAKVCIELAPYQLEHPMIFGMGQRQYGRNYLGLAVAMALQGGGSAYWNQTNKDNALDGVNPSWGSCYAYGADAYAESGRWVSRDYYQSRLRDHWQSLGRRWGLEVDYSGKFLFTKVFKAFSEKYFQKKMDGNMALGKWVIPGLRVVAGAVKVPFFVADVIYVCAILQGMDAMHYYAKRGFLPYFIQHPLDYIYGRDSEFSRMEWALRSTTTRNIARAAWVVERAAEGAESVGVINAGAAGRAGQWVNGVGSRAGERLGNLWVWADGGRRWLAVHAADALRRWVRDGSLSIMRDLGLEGVFNLKAETFVELFRRPINEKILIKKGRGVGGNPKDNLHECWAVQDTRTESEDIASCIFFLRSVGFFNDEANNFLVATWRSWFVPRLLWSSTYIEGIGPLGAHSDDMWGLRVTFLFRWCRGNLAIMPDILHEDFGALRKAKYLSLSAFWLTGAFRSALVASPMFFLLGNLPSVSYDAPRGFIGHLAHKMMTDDSILFDRKIFIPLVIINFATTMSAFMFNQHSAGYLSRDNWKQTIGCMGLEWGGSGRMLQSVWEGTGLGERPPFVVSPKEGNCPVQVPGRSLAVEYAYLGLNWYLAQATFFKAIECWQNDNPLAAATLAPAAAWNLYHGIMGAASLYYLNQGVHRQMPYSSALREWSENLRRGYFAFQFEQNAQKHFWEREARYRQREAERRRRADEDFLRRIDADFLWSPEGRMKAANRPGPTDEEVEQEEAAAVSGGMANAA